MLSDVGRHEDLFISSLAHIGLFSESVLQYLQNLPLLIFLAIVQASLNGQFFLFLLLSVLPSKLLGTFFSTTCVDAAAAPEEDKEENCEAENDNDMLKDPISE